MSSLYDDIARGLQEAMAYERGEGEARAVRRTQRFSAPPQWKPEEIKRLRLKCSMTQHTFADFMGVSAKTVEAWERGRNRPSGSASRLMQVISQNESLLSQR